MKVSGSTWALALCLFVSHGRAEAFNPLRHSGPASPYFDAPSEDGISESTPDGCVVDQAAYIVRHGSRFPEPGSFSGWQSLYQKFQNTSYTASGPLNFIPTWVPAVNDQPHEPLYLSSTGAKEAFELGVELRKKYGFTSGGSNFTIWAAGQQRVVDTATFFLRGYLSQGNYLTAPQSNRGFIVSMPDSVNYTYADSLTSSNGCPNYACGNNGSATSTAFRATYQATIAKRLNRYLNGLTLVNSDIGVMQDLCGFQTEINGNSQFCDIFEESEWLQYEYAHDLNYYYGAGPGNPYSATVGYGWLKAISDLFVTGPNVTATNATFTPPPLLMSFTHDNNLPPIVSALGIWNTSNIPGVYPLPVTHMPKTDPEFSASKLVSFRGYVALERLSCATPLTDSVKHKAGQLVVVPGKGDGAKKYVRIRINNAVVPVPGCTSGPGSSCPLASFSKYIDGPRAAAAGDFVKVCGLQSFSNATGVVDFFTKVPSTMAQSTVVELPVT